MGSEMCIRDRCGVGDYTFNLVSAWSDISEFHYLVARGAAQSKAQYPNLSIDKFECNQESFLTKLAAHEPCHLLIQYSAYGFHRFGCPVWLADALTHWRRQNNGRLAIMFHELWTLSPWWSKQFVIQRVHQWSIGRLVGLAVTSLLPPKVIWDGCKVSLREFRSPCHQ